MATSAQAALLDELMGRNRNAGVNDAKKPETHWDDPDVCKFFLCSFCPHDLFTNTKADLGRCSKIHDDDMKKDYQDSSRVGRSGYEQDFLRYLITLITEIDRKIKRGHDRLAMNAALANGRINSTSEEHSEMLTNKINELVQQAEELGCQGNVEEAQGVMKLCDQLVEERALLEQPKSKDGTNSEFEKEMEVCEICGALLVVGDVQQRIDEHLMGKQHMGYVRIRAYVNAEKAKVSGTQSRLVRERDDREGDREAEREKRRREWEDADNVRKKERDSRREAAESGHHRDGERRHHHKDRHRKRSGSREKGSRDGRSSSRSRHHGSRSDRRHKHRSGSHDKHRSSRHSSGSHDKKHRSRSPRRSKESHRKRSSEKAYKVEANEQKEDAETSTRESRPDDIGPSGDSVADAVPEEVGANHCLDQLDE